MFLEIFQLQIDLIKIFASFIINIHHSFIYFFHEFFVISIITIYDFMSSQSFRVDQGNLNPPSYIELNKFE